MEANPRIGFFEAIKKAFKNYINFNGRSRRSEYWWFCLFNIIIGIILLILAFAFGKETTKNGYKIIEANKFFVILMWIYSIATFLPGLGLSVRRLHDIGKSGWYLLIVFIPFGGFILLYFFCIDSENQSNEYGESPKYGKNSSLV